MILLVVAVVIISHKEYSIYMELKLARNLTESLLSWANRILSKYMQLEFPKLTHISEVNNLVLKALLCDFIDNAHSKGVEVDVLITNPVNEIDMDIYDLYNLISDFMKHAQKEANAHNNKQINIVIDGDDGFYFSIVTEVDKEVCRCPFDINVRMESIDAIIYKNGKSPPPIDLCITQFKQVMCLGSHRFEVTFMSGNNS